MKVNGTAFENINYLLEELVLRLKTTLKEDCLGVYLYGSLVWGDFDFYNSDIDILVIVKNEISDKTFKNLDKLHNLIIQHFPFWKDRIEIAYITKATLESIKSKGGKVAIISPGEAFNIKQAGADWLINCYLLQNSSITLLGPNPKSIIELITKDDFLKTVKQQALEWREWISQTKDSIAYQYYAVLTICRSFYVLQNGEQTSKIRAGEWMAQNHPKWAPLINKAISKNHAKIKATDSNYQEVSNFVNEIISLIEKDR